MYVPCIYAVWPSNPRETLVSLPGRNFEGYPSLFVESSKVRPVNGPRGLLEASLLGFSDESLVIIVEDVANLEKETFLIRFEDLMPK